MKRMQSTKPTRIKENGSWLIFSIYPGMMGYRLLWYAINLLLSSPTTVLSVTRSLFFEIKRGVEIFWCRVRKEENESGRSQVPKFIICINYLLPLLSAPSFHLTSTKDIWWNGEREKEREGEMERREAECRVVFVRGFSKLLSRFARGIWLIIRGKKWTGSNALGVREKETGMGPPPNH